MLLPHWRQSGNCDFSTQSLVFPRWSRMLALQLATSDLLLKTPRPPLRPESLSVDQCHVFIEVVAMTLLLFKPNFTSKCHTARGHFLWWLLELLPSAPSCASLPYTPGSASHDWTQQWQPDCQPPLAKSNWKKKKNLCKEGAVVANHYEMCLLNALKGKLYKRTISKGTYQHLERALNFLIMNQPWVRDHLNFTVLIWAKYFVWNKTLTPSHRNSSCYFRNPFSLFLLVEKKQVASIL